MSGSSGVLVLRLRPPGIRRCVKRIVSHLFLFFAAVGANAATISGVVVGESGEPLREARVQLVQVSLEGCCHDAMQSVASDGAYQFVGLPRSIYAIRVAGNTPYYPRTVRVDARNGDQTGVRVQLSRQSRRYVPDEAPDSQKITVSVTGEKGQAVIRGAAGAVAPATFVILVNTDTGDVAFAEAGVDGSFEGTLFAPPGTSVLVRSDPYGDTMRNVAVQALPLSGVQPFFSGISIEGNVDFNIGPLAPLPGSYVDVPLSPIAGRVAIGGGGGPNGAGMAGVPSWIVRGSLSGNQFSAGDTVELTATISVATSIPMPIEKIAANVHLRLEQLAFADGSPALSHNVQASSLLTPTGLGIMHTMFGASHLGAGKPIEIVRLTSDRAEATFTIQLTLPPNIADGHYRGLLSFGFNGYPIESSPAQRQLLLDSANREGPNVVSLPPIRIGTPAAPRLFWTLLTDTLREGTRGAHAIEDSNCCALTAIVQAPSKYLVIPRVDERTGTPLVYRIEPFAPMIGAGDRGMTVHPPAVRFRFPSGYLIARIERPDGGVDTIGPAPFLQARVGGPLDRHGRVPDPGGLSLHDAYQLSTRDPRFEVTFPVEGRYRISLQGEIEDLAGTRWTGRGTYDLHVGRTLVLDSATLPGTPFEVGNWLTHAVTVSPPVPAQIEVRTQLHHGDAQVVNRTDTFLANRFGAAVGAAVPVDQPGEYRVDVSASYRDPEGRWWFGSRTWGGVVATPGTPIIAHGRRGIDDLPADQQRAWFTRSQTASKFGSGHVHMPFHSGDVAWLQESDAHIPRVTFDDRVGDVFRILGIAREGAAASGEAPLSIAARNGHDPHFDPSAVDAWTYAYRSIQRPAVRVREQIADSTFIPSLYWRFSDQYGQQSGNGRNGDRPNDFKFQFAAVVIRGAAFAQPHYAIYGSLFVLVPDTDPGGGTRVFPPFQGNGGGPSGGPLFTLKGKDVDLFFHPTAVRPGTVLISGTRIPFAGYSAPTLPAKVEILVTSPSGRVRAVSGRANDVGYFFDPSQDFTADEPGVWKAVVKIVFDGQTSAGQMAMPFPTGTVLGSKDGEFSFYVVEPNAAQLELGSMPQFVRPADGPVTFTVQPPPALSNIELGYTITMPGFLLEEKTQASLNVVYDAPTLAKDFPNLDLYDADGYAGVDTITISIMLSGTDPSGARKHFARQVVIQGEEMQMPDQHPRPKRRAVAK